MKDATDLVYRTKTCSDTDILKHFSLCDSWYTEEISRRQPLSEYAAKIAAKATTFEAWEGSNLAGLIAAYMNDPEGVHAYITNVSVISLFAGKGIASELLRNCVSFAAKLGFKEILLEVEENNKRAIDFYLKHGFQVKLKRQQYLVMNFML